MLCMPIKQYDEVSSHNFFNLKLKDTMKEPYVTVLHKVD